jgi:hypothetical protein
MGKRPIETIEKGKAVKRTNEPKKSGLNINQGEALTVRQELDFYKLYITLLFSLN